MPHPAPAVAPPPEPQSVPGGHVLRLIAVTAARDPRVVKAVLSGRRATATSYAAVGDAVRRLGLDIAVPGGPQAA
ncbi:MAG: hypothetical protein ACLP1X_31160 [Polyangiaceae bacterium]